MDRLDDSLVVLGFDVLEGFGRRRKFLSNFFERTLVRAGLSLSQLSEDSENDQSRSESQSQSHSQSLGIILSFLLIPFMICCFFLLTFIVWYFFLLFSGESSPFL